MLDLGYLAALAGGTLALLSPCSALLLPAFFAYAFERGPTLVARTGLFYLGLAATLVPLGAGSTFISDLFFERRETLITVAGVTIIVLGVVQILGGGFALGAAGRAMAALTVRSRLSIVALGAMYGLAGFCSGPILGSVLTIAASSGRPAYGAALLAVYALGMTVPLLLLALGWDRFRLGERGWLRGRSFRVGPFTIHTMSVLSGLIFIVLGVVFLVYDGTSGLPGLVSISTEQRAQTWLQRNLPADLDNVVLPILLAIVGVVLYVRIRRRRATERAQ